MPTYTFENTKTGEIVEIEMKIAEYDEFTENKKNKHLQRVHLTAPAIGDSVRLGIRKPPADFQKGVLDRIKAKHPRAAGLKRTRWGNNISEV